MPASVKRLPCLALVGLAACGSPTAPSNASLDFREEVVFGIPTLPTVATAQERAILVTGVFQTQFTGFTLHGSIITTAPRSLRLDIDAISSSDAFPFLVQNYYRATIGNLVPGGYDLTVVHLLHQDQVKIDTVFRGTLNVQ